MTRERLDGFIGIRLTNDSKEMIAREARRRGVSITTLLGLAIGEGWEKALEKLPVKEIRHGPEDSEGD
ncbi:MAG: hypothetical protein JRJ29_18080 [Deltaproteobacteria bacterium]|nr:hypothetical protein [Deltaproteobacteria bacterium]